MTGVFVRWDVLFWTALIVYGTYIMSLEKRADDAVLVALLVAPILTGTGLLTFAREGRMDLLFGSGASRGAVWVCAFVRAVLLPLALIAVSAAFWLSSPAGTPLTAVGRVLLVGAFTMPAAFAIGLLQPRYVAGVLWAGARIAFLLSPIGRSIYVELTHPDETGGPTLVRAVIGIIGFPEVLLHAPIPAVPTAFLITTSTAMLLISYAMFLRVDFGGHRAA